MSEEAQIRKGEGLLREPPSENVALHSYEVHSDLVVRTLSGPDDATSRNQNSSPNPQSSTNCDSSLSTQAKARKESALLEAMHQNRHRSLGVRASTLVENPTNELHHQFSYDARRPVAPGRVSRSSRSIFAKKSKVQVRRKHALLTTVRTHKQHCGKPKFVKPFELLEDLELKLRTSTRKSQFSDELRRLQLALNIHRVKKSPLTVLPRLEKDHVLKKTPLVPEISDLGLGMVTVTDDRASCSFCMFECTFGSSNEEILLPASASYHRCLNCDPSNSFLEENWTADLSRNLPSTGSAEQKIHISPGAPAPVTYPVLVKSSSGINFYLTVKGSDKVADIKTRVSQFTGIKWDSHHLYSHGAILRDQRLLSEYQMGPRSLIEIIELKCVKGRDITQFWRPGFCRNCPWTQVDVKLATMCLPCATKRLTIVGHSHHGNWAPFFHMALDVCDGNPAGSEGQGNCMVCTKLARMKCAGCPLVVCVNCSSNLDATCKGDLNLLIYSISPGHVRNDAFLLRSDGGGF